MNDIETRQTAERGAQALATCTMPNNIEFEQSVLAAMLLSPDLIADCAHDLSIEDFYRDGHKLIFSTIFDMWIGLDDEKIINAFTVADSLNSRGLLESIGGRPYMTALYDSIPSAANMAYYCRKLKEFSHRRRLIQSAYLIAGVASGGDVTKSLSDAPHEIQALCEGFLTDAGETSSINEQGSGEDTQSFDYLTARVVEYAKKRRETPGRMSGMSTGFGDIDYRTGGLERGELTFLAARPSCGKTALGTEIMLCMGKRGYRCGVISLEMRNESLALRAVCSSLAIDSLRVREGGTSDADIRDMEAFSRRNGIWPIKFKSNFKPTMSGVRSSIRRLVSRDKCDIVMIDYMELISADGDSTGASDTSKVETISRMLKQAARENDCHILCLRQITKRSESTETKRPSMRDLRYAGDAEADNIWMLHRPDQFAEVRKDAAEPQDVFLYIEKCRNGQTGEVKLRYVPAFTRFTGASSFRSDPGQPRMPYAKESENGTL